jgi:hypothetical protein
MDITKLLKEATKDSLSDESLQTIQEAIGAKANEAVSDATSKHSLKLEAALAKQDTEYATKLKTLLEAINSDHTAKMKMLLEGQDAKHTEMLQSLVSKYKGQYLAECSKFKDELVNKTDAFFDIVVEDAIPKKELAEAVENTRYRHLVEHIGKVIGIDKIKHDEIVKEGIVDAKSQIDTLAEQVKGLEVEKSKLLREQVGISRSKLLAEKCEGLPKIKKTYLKKVLGTKSIDFIKENFDYTLELYDAEENSATDVIRKQATQSTKVYSEGVDRSEKIVEEKKAPTQPDFYLNAMEESEG